MSETSDSPLPGMLYDGCTLSNIRMASVTDQEMAHHAGPAVGGKAAANHAGTAGGAERARSAAHPHRLVLSGISVLECTSSGGGRVCGDGVGIVDGFGAYRDLRVLGPCTGQAIMCVYRGVSFDVRHAMMVGCERQNSAGGGISVIAVNPIQVLPPQRKIGEQQCH